MLLFVFCFVFLRLLVLCFVFVFSFVFKQYIYTLCYFFSLKLNFFFALNLFR